jgi:hypothetical protein
MGPNDLMVGREQPLIREKGPWHTAAFVAAEIPHYLHAVAAGTGREMLERETPTGEGGWCQVVASSGQEVVKVSQHPPDSVVLASQRVFDRQIPHHVGSQQRRERS